jgi:uncharacterized membrane-anchored protein YjiN (DUF445 family)
MSAPAPAAPTAPTAPTAAAPPPGAAARPAGPEDERRRELRRMKLGATALLVAAASIYLVARSFEGDPAVWGYVEAFGEAAMVGGLADWFAVTALFRHPLGLPIPHTAIIPARKDQIGRSLGTFVESHFLAHEPVAERLRDAQVGRRVADWLVVADHAARAAEALADALRSLLGAVDDREVHAAVERLVRRRLEDMDAAAVAARAIEVAVEGGHHERLLDSAVGIVQGLIEDHRDTLPAWLGRQSRWWVPEAVDRRIARRLLDDAHRALGELRDSPPGHPLRRSIGRRLLLVAEQLRTDPRLAAQVDAAKRHVLDHPALAGWLDGLWREAKAGIVAATHDRGSELHARTATVLVRVGERLRDDAVLRARVDAGVETLVLYVVDHYGSEITALIESTVARWDAPSTSRRLELQVGRDLQFVRINGTLVGGLAGVLIHVLGTHVL